MITLKVIPDNAEPYTVTATTRDVLTWEKTTKGNKSFVDLISEPNLVDLYRVAWLASWRQKLTTAANYDEFERTVEVEGVEAAEDEPADPTQPVPSVEHWSPSQSEQESAPKRGRRKANEQS